MSTAVHHRISLLVLAHLGLAVACADKPATTPETAKPLEIPPMPSASATPPKPVPTAPPSATVSTPSTPVGDDDDDPAMVPTTGKVCRSQADCPSGRCDITPGKKAGQCRSYIIRGRPLLVDGSAFVADYQRPVSVGVTTEEALRLREAAREEHASIAAFARTIAELMALGAPTWLLEETAGALGDEIAHTERSLAMIEKLTGERLVIGPLDAAVAPLRRPIEELFRDVLRGGAIGETLAAAEAETRRLATNDDDLRAFYETIVSDESRHAALAIKTLRWLLTQEPSLRVILDEGRGNDPLSDSVLEAAFG